MSGLISSVRLTNTTLRLRSAPLNQPTIGPAYAAPTSTVSSTLTPVKIHMTVRATKRKRMASSAEAVT